jgi:hypothetical protein
LLTDREVSPALVIVDTSVYMHCRRFDEIDWRDVVGADAVTLVIPVQVLRELDEQKDQHRSRAMRERVRGVIRRIKELVRVDGPAPVRAGVTIALDARRISAARVAELELDPEHGDDNILAAAATLRDARTGQRVVLVARDVTQLLFGAQLGLEIVEMPPAFQLDDEPDPAEKQLRALQLEHTRLLNARARLEVAFENGEGRIEHVYEPPPPLSDDLVTQLADEAVDRASQDGGGRFPPSFDQIVGQADLVARYDRELDRYRADYHDYVRGMHRWAEYAARRIRIACRIRNTGSVPATDISIELSFPPGWAVQFEDEAVEPPAPLPKPVKMGELMFRLRSKAPVYTAAFREPYSDRLRAVAPGFGRWIGEGSDAIVVTYRRPKLRQADTEVLDAILVTPPSAEMRSFSFPYELRADNMDPEESRLHVIVRAGESAPPAAER